MSLSFQRLITNEGQFLLAYDTVSEAFMTPPLKTVTGIARRLTRRYDPAVLDGLKKTRLRELAEEAQAHPEHQTTYDLTSKEIDRFLPGLAELKAGHPLPKGLGGQLEDLYHFFCAALVPHLGIEYPELNNKIITQWFEELKIKNGDEFDLFGAVYQVSARKANRAERIMVGRYMGAFMNIARITGPKKRTPVQFLRNSFRPKKSE